MRRIKIGQILLFSLLCATLAQAQAAPPAQTKPPAGHLRVWHFASNLKGQVSVSLVGGAPRPTILARALMLSDVMNYSEIPPGRYKLTVRASEKDFNVTEASPELIPAVEIVVVDKTFQTVILQNDANTTKVFLVNDSPTGAGIPRGSKRLRIFNFAPGQDASLRTAPKNDIIAAPLNAGMSEHLFPNNPGSLTLVMSNKLKNGREAHQSVEANFTAVDSISALVMLDRYGRLTFQSVEDAKSE